MATLVSPGVSIEISNEAAYGSAGAGTVPLFVIATASNKAAPGGFEIAPSTLTEQAGQVKLVTSQRDLVQNFGNPFFHTLNGTPVHGHELNEYGLHAAYSYLGAANRAYVLRADVDLDQLEASDTPPQGAADAGQYWLDLSATRFGLFESIGGNNAGTAWESRTVLTPSDNDLLNGVPKASFGAANDFAYAAGLFYEKFSSTWQQVGSSAWVTAKTGTPVLNVTNSPQYPGAVTAGQMAVGSVWVKLSPPNKGAVWALKYYNGTTGQWVNVQTPFFASDDEARQNGVKVDGQVYGRFAGPNRIVLRRIENGVFENLDYVASAVAPTSDPVDGTLWYSANVKVDVMVNYHGQQWVGYHSAQAGHTDTDPAGVIVAGSQPTTQSDGTPLVDEDLWLNSADLENYPRLFRYNATTRRWKLIDTTDQTTPFGMVFADAREADSNGSTAVADLLVSNNVDPDAPAATAYPHGMLLFNTRYSTGNVKVYRPNWFAEGGYDPNTNYLYAGDVTSVARWVSASGNDVQGRAHMFRQAQRIMVVRAMAAALASNDDIRSEMIYFNIMAAPGYPELVDELITLNTDQKEVAFIAADTPARLSPQSTELLAWATNRKSAAGNGEAGLVSSSPYAAVYYPWGLSTNVDGTDVMVPPSTLAMRTYAYNDSVAYPWMAPAGVQRGLVTNASAVGYLTAEGEFRAVSLNQGQRDTLYTNRVNPIAFMPGSGLMIYGQKTLDPSTTSLDRINVARLVNYMRYNLDKLVKPFLFQPNDPQTRDAARLTVERFLIGLVGLRALEDFAVVCDESNNTAERRDRSELWIDVVIKPIKAVEFIYVPVRIRDSGASLDV